MSEQLVSKYDLMKLTSIRSCTPEDYADVRALFKAAIQSAGWHFYGTKEVATKLLEIDDPDYTIALMDQNIVLAKIGDYLVGASSWRPSSEHPQTAVITALYIDPLFANGGIATALIKQNEQTCYDQGFRWISAQSDFNSRPFFTRLGYESKGYKGCIPERDVQYPLEIMTRHISAQYAKTH